MPRLGADGSRAGGPRTRPGPRRAAVHDRAPAPANRPDGGPRPPALRITHARRRAGAPRRARAERGRLGLWKPRELCFLLASSPGLTKAQIGLALWPELDGPRLRNAFHTALRELRRALGDPGRIVYGDGRYALDLYANSGRTWTSSSGPVRARRTPGRRRPRPLQEALARLRRPVPAWRSATPDWALERGADCTARSPGARRPADYWSRPDGRTRRPRCTAARRARAAR